MSALTSRIPLILYAAAVVFAGLAANSVMGYVLPGGRSARPAEIFQEIRREGASRAAAVSLEGYVTVRPDRFCARVDPPPAPPPPAPEQPQPQAPQPENPGLKTAYVLRGTLVHSNPALSWAFVEVPGVEEQRAYRLGESVQGSELIAIDHDVIKLKRADEIITVTVNYADESQQASNPAAGGSGDGAQGGERGGERGRQGERQFTREELMRRWPPAFQRLFEAETPEMQDRIVSMTNQERMEYFRAKLGRSRNRDGEAGRNRSEGRNRNQ